MACFFRRNQIGTAVVSLILLAASVAAPFRTHAFGRTLLFGSGHPSARSPVIRVRVIPGGGFAQGFRAIVGFAKGGSGGRQAKAPTLVRSHPSSSSPAIVPSQHSARLGARPHPPLRC